MLSTLVAVRHMPEHECQHGWTLHALLGLCISMSDLLRTKQARVSDYRYSMSWALRTTSYMVLCHHHGALSLSYQKLSWDSTSSLAACQPLGVTGAR